MMSEQNKSSSSHSSGNAFRIATRWLMVFLVIGAIVWVTFIHKPNEVQHESQSKKDPNARPSPVLVAKSLPQDINVYLNALGTITPRNSVTVKSLVDGQLIKLFFREGQMIKKGEMLALIDTRPFEVQLAQAQGQLDKDKALLENALIDLNRYKTLLEQDSISKQQADTQEALVRQYRGAISVDESQVANANLQLSYCHITAPISGLIGLRQVDPGNMIHTSDTSGIVSIIQLQPITALFNLPEDNLPTVMNLIKSRKPIKVEAYDRAQNVKLATGLLLNTDNSIDTTTGSIKMRAEFKNEDGSLFPNQFVNIKLLTDVEKDAVVVPISGVQHGRNGDFVYVVENEKTVRMSPVTTGHQEGEFVSIKQGLALGEEIVIDGADKLRDGANVKIILPDSKQGSGSSSDSKKRSQSKEGWHHKQNAE